MTQLFTGDYSSASFRQWPEILTTQYQGATSAWPADGQYPAQIVALGDCGYAARYELRPGDVLPELSSERVEVTGEDSWAPANTTRWYAFSIKFDSTWPDQTSLGWLEVLQFRDNVGGSVSPTVSFGWAVVDGVRSGYWYLKHNPQSAPGVGLSPTNNLTPVAEMPLDLGLWQDIKLRVTWSTDDAVGTLKLWRNGVSQTLVGGSDTFTGRTLCPGSTAANAHQGIYRAPTAKTNILYHAGFRVADTEDTL